MKFVNLTPHTINVVGTSGAMVASFEPSGQSARCVPSSTLIRMEGEIPLYETKLGPLTGLPEPQEGTCYITSLAAKQAAQAQGRTDVVSPGELVRGENGQPVGCKGLSF